jgi:hypothetical protein
MILFQCAIYTLFYLQTNQIGVTEHIEGDECKFALWTGTVAPISDYKIILRVSRGIGNNCRNWKFVKKTYIWFFLIILNDLLFSKDPSYSWKSAVVQFYSCLEYLLCITWAIYNQYNCILANLTNCISLMRTIKSLRYVKETNLLL